MKKTVVLGVTGGIAAYKACDLVSRMVKEDIDVKVIMTKHAAEFVSPLTFQSLSNNYVSTDMFESPKSWDIEHIALAKQADVFAVVPATANVIGKIAGGIADDMLTTTIMAATSPKVIAPAMNTNMYENIITQENIAKLRKLGYKIVDPASGRLACGDIGQGKLAPVEEIFEAIKLALYQTNQLQGKKIMITAGPTRESLDPVRYITNHSSGKMGYALAQEAVYMGAEVTLITGPVQIPLPYGIHRVIQIETAQEMLQEATKYFDQMDIVIKAAAVADYRPKTFSDSKIKKSDQDMTLSLEKNPDIAMALGKQKKNQLLIGFAAETNDLVANALSKLQRKNMDMIVLNDVKQPGAGFNVDTNIVRIINRLGQVEELPMMSKKDTAREILLRVKGLEQ